MQTYTDNELKEYVYELRQIIADLLFQEVKHTEAFKNTPQSEKDKIVNEFIAEKIRMQVF